MPPISVLIKPASSLCNMSCDYCFYCDEAQKRSRDSFGFMTEQTLKNTIRKTMLRAEGMIQYAFQGGEPTLRGLDFFKKAVAYQKQYNKNHIPVHNALQTNGYALTDEWCRFFKENHFLIGLSVDGTEDIHNSLRHGKTAAKDIHTPLHHSENDTKTFQKVLHSAKRMDQYQVDYNILTVVTPAVAHNIADIYSFYKKQGWHYQQYIACLDPLGEKRGVQPYSISPEQYGQFLIDLFNLWYKDYKHGKQPYIRQFENYVGLAAGYMAESCDQRGVCGIQNVVEADGSVYPCDFFALDPYKLGTFNVNQMEQIDQRRIEIGFIQRSRKLDSRCIECPYYLLCRGGCQRCRDFDPKTGLYSNYFCPAFKMFFDACYARITEVSQGL